MCGELENEELTASERALFRRIEFFEAKYKTCRAAFLEMSRMHNREKKEAKKNRQRIIQLAKDGIDRLIPVGKTKMWSMLNDDEKFALRQFEKVLGLLGLSGYSAE